MSFGLMQCPARLLFEQAFRFPTGEAFVDHVHWQTELFMETRGKSRGFFHQVAPGPVEAEAQSDDDLPHTMFAREFAQAPHIFIAIDTLESDKGARHPSFGVRDGEANACAAVVDAQNRARVAC